MPAQQSDSLVRRVREAVVGRYDEPQRYYHTRAHIAEVEAALHTLIGPETLPPSLQFAAWFHDAVYDPGQAAGANERGSAELARSVLGSLGVPDCVIAEVCGHILATIAHEVGLEPDPSRRARRAAFLDADLWILSAEQPRYEQYCRQVRQEYKHVPEALFRAGRAQLLAALTAREYLYCTEHARTHWEHLARANLDRELHSLQP
ncbi:HD domain-containing protein [Gephyromycinifex aptenodytis]|uniref:HD domain-containing protein n=1 Tax=Gephyromycinifex aptenodytis TaxID=2716227 RepID=UPI001447EFD3|nr:metal-dependent phosphohydrolase [Gephyromycinifex aptenodytis]